MITRAEFHFVWVYTFSATPRFYGNWSPDHTERGRFRPSTSCATVLIIWQLIPMHMQHHVLKLVSNKANSLRLPQFPAVLALVCFSCWNANFIAKSTPLSIISWTAPNLRHTFKVLTNVPLLFVLGFHPHWFRRILQEVEWHAEKMLFATSTYATTKFV